LAPDQRIALTIAGSDPSGGAGIQADLKTFHQFGVYGEAAITLLTVQNTRSVSQVVCMEPGLVAAQVRAVLEDLPPHAAKTGALGNRALVETVAGLAADFAFPLIVDPVMISKHGAPLVSADARAAIASHLLPRAFLITPNLPEASALCAREVRDLPSMRDAAERLVGMGARAALVKGGHLEDCATDILFWEGKWYEYAAARVDTPHTHGTGCTYSAAITANLALGFALPEAVGRAKLFVAEAIRTNPGLGGGSGPVNHHARIPK
jgi:hydroxymethylpyrimidine/phosphomethylpyrimidine kinase